MPPPQAAWGGRPGRRSRRLRPPPTRRRPAAGVRAAAPRRPTRQPDRAYRSIYAPPSFAGAPGAGAEVEVHDGSRAMEVQTVSRGVVTGTRQLFNPRGVDPRSGDLDAVRRHPGHRPRAGDLHLHGPRRRHGEDPVRGLAVGRQGVQVLLLEGALARASCRRVRRPRRRHRAVVHGPQAARQVDRQLRHRLGRRGRRAGLGRLRAVLVAPAGRRDRRRLRHQRHAAHGRRGLPRRPELPAAAVHPAARLQLLVAARRVVRLDCGETTFVITSTPSRARSRFPSSPGSGASRSTRSARRSA